MRIIRFLYQGQIYYGVLKGEEVLFLRDFPEKVFSFSKKTAYLKEIKLLAPCNPSKIIALGLNYKNHAQELGMDLPLEPLIFLKAPSAIIGPEEHILLPPQSQRVDYEGELAIVIKKTTRRVPDSQIYDYILGYTCFNDVTARDLQQKDGQWARCKSFDTFAPLGPWIESELDPSSLKIETKVNGQLKQSSSTEELIFPIEEIVSYISHIMTLYPGDVIATGTPPGVGPLQPGDVVEISIEGIGTLRNYVQKLSWEGLDVS